MKKETAPSLFPRIFLLDATYCLDFVSWSRARLPCILVRRNIASSGAGYCWWTVVVNIGAVAIVFISSVIIYYSWNDQTIRWIDVFSRYSD